VGANLCGHPAVLSGLGAREVPTGIRDLSPAKPGDRSRNPIGGTDVARVDATSTGSALADQGPAASHDLSDRNARLHGVPSGECERATYRACNRTARVEQYTYHNTDTRSRRHGGCPLARAGQM